MCDTYVNNLSNELLFHIFDRVPLLNLLQLDQVCQRWACLLPSVCARRRSLTFILGGKRMDELYYFEFSIPFNSTFDVSFDGGMPYFDLPSAEHEASLILPNFLLQNNSFDEFLLNDNERGFFDILYSVDGVSEEKFTEMARLHHAHITGHLVNYCADLFPNVTNLVVIHPECNEDELHSLVDLLRPLSLFSLKLWIQTKYMDDKYINRRDHHPVLTLLRSIDQQSHNSLKQLTLNIGGDGFETDFTFPAEPYSFIAKLKVVKLAVGWYDFNRTIWDILHRFGSTELNHIGLANYYFPRMGETALNLKFEFTKVRQLYVWPLQFRNVEQFDEFCWRFSSLTSLQIYWTPNITFTQLVANLSSLGQLTYLYLHIGFDDHPENRFALVDQVGGGDEEPRRLSLPQVKTLELFILSPRSYHNFGSLGPLVFPSVKAIILRDLGTCTICQPNINRINQYDRERTNPCHRLLILLLKNRFANLKVRLYAMSLGSPHFVDWSNYGRTVDEVEA